MSFDSKFAAFLTALNNCPFDLPAELHPHFRSSLVSAGFDKVVAGTVTVTAGVSGGGGTVAAPKKLSGYNLFMREKMAELRSQEVPSPERMGKVSTMWRELSDADKAVWKTNASELTAAAPAAPSPAASKPKTKKDGPSVLSGYQLFVREKMPEVKEDTTVVVKDRMAALGAKWKALTEADHTEWKTKAETENAKTKAEYEATQSAATPAPTTVAVAV